MPSVKYDGEGYTRGIFSISPLDGVKTLVDLVGPHPGKTWEPNARGCIPSTAAGGICVHYLLVVFH